MSERLQNILGISFFLILIGLIIWYSFRMKEQNTLIDEYGAETIAKVQPNRRPVKSQIWEYAFVVNNKTYKGTTSKSKKKPYKIKTGYSFIVEYYIKDPQIHRLVLSKPVFEKAKTDPFMLDSMFKEIDENIGIAH